MPTNKNITIKQYNGSDYDVLYPATIVSQVSGAIPSDEKGTANGVASLGNDGKVPNTQLPPYTELWISTKSYAAGAYCVHNGYLWHNTSGAASTGVEPSTNYTVWNVTYRNDNLLDNPFFTVRQRGVTSGTITSGMYTVDRWIAENIFYNTANNALTLQAAGTWSMFFQILDNFEHYKGLTVTLSCDAVIVSGSNAALVIDDGGWHAVPLQNGITKIVYTMPQSATHLQAMIFANYSADASDTTTIVVKSIKLELGSVSTLANDIAPNYAEELLKCQTSRADPSDTYSNKSVATLGNVSTITLTAAGWIGTASPYTQSVSITGVTANSKVDLQPDAAAIAQMMDDSTAALYINNNNGTLTAYAVGEKPSADIGVQTVVTEVTV